MVKYFLWAMIVFGVWVIFFAVLLVVALVRFNEALRRAI